MHHAAFRILTGTVVAVALCAAPRLAAAQASAAAGPAPTTAAITAAQRHDWERIHRMSKIIGIDLRTKSGDKVGDIKDVIVDDAGEATAGAVGDPPGDRSALVERGVDAARRLAGGHCDRYCG